MKEFKGTKGDIYAKGLNIQQVGKVGRIGQAFFMDFKHDNAGKSLPDEQGEANAKLWAASYDMLEALKQGSDLMEYLINATPTGKVRDTMFDFNIIARSAIQKALS